MNPNGPFAEDLVIGVPLKAAPDITVDEGLAAQYLAISGDQLRLALSGPLSAQVTGTEARLANPGLVIGLSIGQSTIATRRVIANLFYRNLTLLRPVHVGETIRTVVTPLQASWTRSGTDRAKVLLNMQLTTSEGEEISTYQRLALLPVAESQKLVTADSTLDESYPDLADYAACVPTQWRHPAQFTGAAVAVGDKWDDPLADTVSSARELVRLTQNQAAAHRDARAGLSGRRLVYGGHTVALAQASLSRVLPDVLTVLAWRSCDHLAPVFEEDLLSFTTRIDNVREFGQFRLVDATVTATAHREGSPPLPVLKWLPVLLLSGRNTS